MANGRFIPQPDVNLLMEIARQRGKIAQAPFALAGKAFGTIGDILKENTLKRRQEKLDTLQSDLKIAQTELAKERKTMLGEKSKVEGFKNLIDVLGAGQFTQQQTPGATQIPPIFKDISPGKFFTPSTTAKSAASRLVKLTKQDVDFLKSRLGTDFPVKEGDDLTVSERADLRKLAVNVKLGKIGKGGKLTDIQKQNIKSIREQKKTLLKKIDGFTATQEDVDKMNETIRLFEENTGVAIGEIPPVPKEDDGNGGFWKKAVKLILDKLTSAFFESRFLNSQKLIGKNENKKPKSISDLAFRG
jgi:hypothetical protein